MAAASAIDRALLAPRKLRIDAPTALELLWRWPTRQALYQS